jgi:ABC-type multidrug transport system fused ATPase/permease subunit
MLPTERSSTPSGPRTNTEGHQYVLKRYDHVINYYWGASKWNKRWYKWTRYLVIMLGALVTLLASLASSDLIQGAWKPLVGLATPVAAAVLTIISGLSQAFQWGPAWQEMVLTAERLEKERDRIRVSPDGSDPVKDLETLNGMVLNESVGFFTRILGSSQPTAAVKDVGTTDQA